MKWVAPFVRLLGTRLSLSLLLGMRPAVLRSTNLLGRSRLSGFLSRGLEGAGCLGVGCQVGLPKLQQLPARLRWPCGGLEAG